MTVDENVAQILLNTIGAISSHRIIATANMRRACTTNVSFEESLSILLRQLRDDAYQAGFEYGQGSVKL